MATKFGLFDTSNDAKKPTLKELLEADSVKRDRTISEIPDVNDKSVVDASPILKSQHMSSNNPNADVKRSPEISNLKLLSSPGKSGQKFNSLKQPLDMKALMERQNSLELDSLQQKEQPTDIVPAPASVSTTAPKSPNKSSFYLPSTLDPTLLDRPKSFRFQKKEDSFVLEASKPYKNEHVKFIRSIRRSYPSTAEEARYRQALPLFDVLGKTIRPSKYSEEEGLSGRVNDLEKAFLMPVINIADMKVKTEVDQTILQILHWESIKKEKILSMSKGSVWWTPEYSSDNQPISCQDLQTYFPMAAGGMTSSSSTSTTSSGGISSGIRALISASNSKTGNASKPVPISVLEPRRATTISIAMKKLGIKPERFAKLAWSFRDMNESFLTREAVEIIQSNILWPANEQELLLLKNRVEDGKELAEPDKLLWFFATSIPDIQARVCAMAFRYEFDESVDEMIQGYGTIEVASKEVLASKHLKKFLRIVIKIGNQINAQGNPKYVPVVAVTLESLSRLASTKSSVNKNISVMDCVAKYIDENIPDLKDLSSYLMCTPAAAKFDVKDQEKTIADARRGLDKIRTIKKMEAFSAEASKKLFKIEKNLQKAQEIFGDALQYFGYDRYAMDSSKFFTALKDVLDAFDKAVENLDNPDRDDLGGGRDTFNYSPINTIRRTQTQGSNSSFKNTRKSIFGRLRPGI